MTATADAFMSIFGFKRVKPGVCAICTAEFKQQRMGQKTCADPVCHTGTHGIHGDRLTWKLAKMSETKALEKTLEAIYG